ncbi:MAG: T9SS type B sorting domain-containing protein, partial [bacterium]
MISNPTPEATVPSVYALCDVNQVPGVGFENFNLNSRIPEILGSIDPTTVTVSFYTSLADAQSGTSAITNVTSYPNGTINTQTLYVRVEFIATGCFDIVPLTLVVNPLPNATQPNYPQYSLCDVTQSAGDIGYEVFDLGSRVNSILLGQTGMDVTFYISLGDAQNGTGLITNLLYRNQIQFVQTLGIRITNRLTGCFVVSTMDIRVEPLPSLIPLLAPYTICDDNQDGTSCGFDLSTLIPDLLQGANYTLSFHETLTNAQTGAIPINISQPYCTVDPFVQTLYVRAVDNVTGCWSTLPIELNVDPSPIAPVLLDDIVLCDTDSNPQSGSTIVNLTQRTPDVLAQQPPPASDYTVTYYLSQSDAQTGPSAALFPASAYFGTNLQTIWVRVENTVTQCYNIGSFQLKINTPLLLTTPAPLNVCDDDATPNNQFHVFDLTVKNAEITQNLPGHTVTYYPSLALAQAGVASTAIQTPTAYQNVAAAVQTLGVVVTTPDPARCQSITTLDIRVLPIPTPRTNPPALAPKCDDTLPGDLVEVFDLTVNEGYIANGDANLSFHYFPTQADAAANNTAVEILPANAALVGGNVWIRVENNRVDYQGNNCYVLVEQALQVNPLHTVVQPLAPFRACDDDADGITVFNLADPILATQILGTTQSPTDYTISYYATAAGANPLTNTGETPLPSSYTNTSSPNTQSVYIRVVNNATGCVNATGVLDLVVEDYATATSPAVYAICDSDSNPFDGVETIDLNQFAAGILGTQDPAVFLLSYYTSLADAVAGSNALTPAEVAAYQTDADTDTIWVKVENSSNSITPFCYAIAQISITIERRPNPVITTANGVNTICVDFVSGLVVRDLTLNSGIANPANYTFEWFEANDLTTVIGTGPTYTVNTASATPATPREYVVHVTNNTALGCDTTSAAFSVIQSGQAVIPAGTTGYVISNAFSEMQTITVNITGYGDYQYSLDDGPRQDSNIFTNVSLGPHRIYVWDNAGGVAYSCEALVIELVQTIDYPYYFTPNGDGIHDTWNIVGLQYQPGAKIYIFDRYGKLLKQISAAGNGWDGTYNGYLMPSDDYWFTVDYIE